MTSTAQPVAAPPPPGIPASPWWFGVPFLPVSVLDARSGAWQRRKRAWRALIGDGAATRPGLSTFDPVLAMTLYRWFATPGDLILDPFAGGATRGLVAAHESYRYIGVDVRADQVTANRAAVTGSEPVRPVWLHGDARHLDHLDLPTAVDLLLTCPPYADLERYSDQPDDLSTLDYPTFRDAHTTAITQATARLADDRFAIWVVGEATGPDGNLLGITADTTIAFRDAGLALHSQAVLITPLGNLHVRVGAPFAQRRTLGRAHQTVLIFVKGSATRAAERAADTQQEPGE